MQNLPRDVVLFGIYHFLPINDVMSCSSIDLYHRNLTCKYNFTKEQLVKIHKFDEKGYNENDSLTPEMKLWAMVYGKNDVCIGSVKHVLNDSLRARYVMRAVRIMIQNGSYETAQYVVNNYDICKSFRNLDKEYVDYDAFHKDNPEYNWTKYYINKIVCECVKHGLNDMLKEINNHNLCKHVNNSTNNFNLHKALKTCIRHENLYAFELMYNNVIHAYDKFYNEYRYHGFNKIRIMEYYDLIEKSDMSDVKLNILRILIESDDVDNIQYYFVQICADNNQKMIQVFKEYVDINFDGGFSMNIACTEGHKLLVKLRRTTSGFDIRKIDNCLECACNKGEFKSAKLLLQLRDHGYEYDMSKQEQDLYELQVTIIDHDMKTANLIFNRTTNLDGVIWDKIITLLTRKASMRSTFKKFINSLLFVHKMDVVDRIIRYGKLECIKMALDESNFTNAKLYEYMKMCDELASNVHPRGVKKKLQLGMVKELISSYIS
jgi:hypothetical protein